MMECFKLHLPIILFQAKGEFRYDEMSQEFKEDGIDGILVLKLKTYNRIKSTMRGRSDSSIELFSDHCFYGDGSSSDPTYAQFEMSIPVIDLYDKESGVVRDYKNVEDILGSTRCHRKRDFSLSPGHAAAVGDQAVGIII